MTKVGQSALKDNLWADAGRSLRSYIAVTAADILPLWENRDFEMIRIGLNSDHYINPENFGYSKPACYWTLGQETAKRTRPCLKGEVLGPK